MVSFKTSLICSVLAVMMVFSSVVTVPVNISAQTADRVAFSGPGSNDLKVFESSLDPKERIGWELVDYRNYIALLSPVPIIVLNMLSFLNFIIFLIALFIGIDLSGLVTIFIVLEYGPILLLYFIDLLIR